jgi:prevent-host-death family protein
MCYIVTHSSIVGVRELRQNLSVYLARVKKGEALTVTEHGAVVAVLRPVQHEDSVIGRLLAEGRVRPATRPPSTIARARRIKLPKPLSRILDDQREDSI